MLKLPFTLLYILTLAGIYTGTAQSTEYNPPTESSELSEYNKVYQEYKTLYIKKLDSGSHYNKLSLSQQFLKKLKSSKKIRCFCIY